VRAAPAPSAPLPSPSPLPSPLFQILLPPLSLPFPPLPSPSLPPLLPTNGSGGRGLLAVLWASGLLLEGRGRGGPPPPPKHTPQLETASMRRSAGKLVRGDWACRERCTSRKAGSTLILKYSYSLILLGAWTPGATWRGTYLLVYLGTGRCMLLFSRWSCIIAALCTLHRNSTNNRLVLKAQDSSKYPLCVPRQSSCRSTVLQPAAPACVFSAVSTHLIWTQE